MAGLANINIKFAADLKGFSTGMQNANRSILKMSKKMQSMGAALTVGVTAPLTAFAAVSLKNWDTQVKAIAQVETGLKSTGNAVGFTSKQLQKMASDLQNTSLFGDEAILKDVTAQLLTFTNIAGNQFARTQQAALDLSTRLDGDLKSASIQLGKALNDPVANLSALSRSGIQFSEDQKAMINSLVETNKLAEAQDIILTELEKQYGNSASAAAKAGTGPLKQLSNAFGDLQEEVGAVIGSAILPLVDKLMGMVSAFQALSPETKKWIVILGSVAAALGPILALAGTILPALMTGFTLLTGPIGLIAAGLTAVGVIIYKNWEPIKAQLVEIGNYFIDLYNESTVFRVAVESVVLTFKNMWAVGKFALNAIWSLLKGLASSFVDNFKLIGGIIKAVFTGNFSQIGGIVEKFKKDTNGTFAATVSNLGDDWSGLMDKMKSNTQTAFNNIAKRTKIKLVKENVDTSAIAEKAAEISPVVVGATTSNGGVKNKKMFFDDSIDFSLDNVDQDILDQAERINDALASIEIEKEDARLAEGMGNIVANFRDFSEQTSQIITNTANAALNGFGEMIGGLLSGTVTMGDVAGSLLSIIGNMATELGKAAVAIGVGMLSIKAAFSNPFTAIAAGVGLIAIGALISNAAKITSGNDAGGFENGGIVGGNSFTGDKLFARINSGEMVLNKRQQSNLGNMLTPAAQQVNVNLTGNLKIAMRQLIFEIKQEEKLLSRTQA